MPVSFKAVDIEQASRAASQMKEVTQQNATLVEEADAASQLMQDEASTLAQVVGVFRLSGRQTMAVATPVHKPMGKHASPAFRTAAAPPAKPAKPVTVSGIE